MNNNVRKIFDMLGVEPNEEFGIKNINDILCFYKIDENLNVFEVTVTTCWSRSNISLGDFLTEKYKIVKLPKKKKLRDLTLEEYRKWKDKKCECECKECLFHFVHCYIGSDDGWIKHKDLYSDKFLDQEVEIPE